MDFWTGLKPLKVDDIIVHKVFFKHRAFLLLDNFHLTVLMLWSSSSLLPVKLNEKQRVKQKISLVYVLVFLCTFTYILMSKFENLLFHFWLLKMVNTIFLNYRSQFYKWSRYMYKQNFRYSWKHFQIQYTWYIFLLEFAYPSGILRILNLS